MSINPVTDNNSVNTFNSTEYLPETPIFPLPNSRNEESRYKGRPIHRTPEPWGIPLELKPIEASKRKEKKKDPKHTQIVKLLSFYSLQLSTSYAVFILILSKAK